MNLNKKIVSLLKRKKIKIAFAESCTGGMLSSTITSVSGSSKVFKLALITYSNKSKVNILKVPSKIINKYGAVSMQCCLSMVENLSKISKSNINISITGIAGPKGGSKNKPVGLVFIGFKINKKIFIKKYLFKKKDRVKIQKASIAEVSKFLLNFLK